MLTTRQIIPESMRRTLRHDKETEAYYAELRELEQSLELLAREADSDEPRVNDDSPLELTDYLLIEDV